MKAMTIAILCIVATLVGARPSGAAPVLVNANAFTGVNSAGVIVIDFEDLAAGTEILSHYAALGVVFSAGLFGEAPPLPTLGFGAISATNADPHGNLNIELLFSKPVQRVGFDFFTNPDNVFDVTVHAFVAGTNTVFSSTFPAELAPQFFGVGDDPYEGGFDRLIIETNAPNGTDRGFAINDLRFVVPEPASLMLMGTGAMALGGRAWRARRRRR